MRNVKSSAHLGSDVEPGDIKGGQWCEYAVPNFLPALRANIVFSLSQRYGLSQRQVAERLGLSQAAVSHYITYRRGSGTRLRKHPDLTKYADKLADRVASGLSGARLTAAICGVCTSFRQAEGIRPCFCIYEGVSRPEFLVALGDGVGFPKQPCETFVVKRLLPVIRAETARLLSERLSQQQVAAALGVTQPAISQYIASRRGEDHVAGDIGELRESVQVFAQKLERGLSAEDRKGLICQMCVDSRRELSPLAPRGH